MLWKRVLGHLTARVSLTSINTHRDSFLKHLTLLNALIMFNLKAVYIFTLITLKLSIFSHVVVKDKYLAAHQHIYQVYR